jgi:hypothetical protein
MNDRYTITFRGIHATISLVVEYNELGVLRALKFEDQDLTQEVVAFCYMRIPYLKEGLIDMSSVQTPITIEEVPKDLSFNMFWETYAYKIGNKDRAIKLWTALVESDRIKCLRSIRQYNQYLKQRPAMERLYPETYLKQERFRNEFKIK